LKFEDIIVEQAHVNSANMRKIANIDKYGGPCLHHAYRSANLFPTHGSDVAMALGVTLLENVMLYKLPLSAIMPVLDNLVCFGLTHLATDVGNWRWNGDPELADHFRGWLNDCSLVERQRRVRNLLGISERRANQFALLDYKLNLVATSDIAEALAAVEGPPPIVFDAVNAAKNLERVLRGALFICRDGEGK